MTLAHNLSVLHYFLHIPRLSLDSYSDNPLLHPSGSRNKYFYSYLLFLWLSECLHAHQWNYPFLCATHLSELVQFSCDWWIYLITGATDHACLVDLPTGESACNITLVVIHCLWFICLNVNMWNLPQNTRNVLLSSNFLHAKSRAD